MYLLLGWRAYRQNTEVAYLPIESVFGSDNSSPNIERVHQHLRNLQGLVDIAANHLKRAPLLQGPFVAG